MQNAVITIEVPTRDKTSLTRLLGLATADVLPDALVEFDPLHQSYTVALVGARAVHLLEVLQAALDSGAMESFSERTTRLSSQHELHFGSPLPDEILYATDMTPGQH